MMFPRATVSLTATSRPRGYFFLLLVALLAPLSCGGESTPEQRMHDELATLRSEMRALQQLRHEVQSLRSDMTEMRARLRTPESGERAITAVQWKANGSHLDDPYLGEKDAPLIVMAFADYQCKPCRAFYEKTFDALAGEFVDSKKVRFIFRDFPLQKNEQAIAAATFAHCAGEQGQYWQAFSLLFEQQPKVEAGAFEELSSELVDIEQGRFSKCLKDTVYRKEIAADIDEGRSLGGKGAPFFFIGKLDSSATADSASYSGVLVRGAQPYGVLRAEIEKLL